MALSQGLLSSPSLPGFLPWGPSHRVEAQYVPPLFLSIFRLAFTEFLTTETAGRQSSAHPCASHYLGFLEALPPLQGLFSTPTIQVNYTLF